MVATNTGIFLRGLKLFMESRTSQVLLVSKKNIWGNHAFFRDNKALTWKTTKKKNATGMALYFATFENNRCLIISKKKKCVATPNFLFGFLSTC